MPERAEIEAVKAVLLDADLWVRMRMDDMPLPADAAHDIALDVVAALDRVRDARGDDELSDEQLDAMRGREDPRVAAALPAARPPQGEDHEAGIEAALQAYWKSTRVADGSTTFRDDIRAAIAAYLAHVSLSRDGTVAVADVRAFVDFCAHGMVTDQTPADEFAQAVRWRARRLLAQFGPARAGVSDEGGNH